jgi:hypothetical protein
MAAAGDGLVFGEGKRLQRVSKAQPLLVQAAKDAYAADPSKFLRVTGDLLKGDFMFAGRPHECLVLRRTGARVYLLLIARVVDGVGISSAEIENFKEVFER